MLSPGGHIARILHGPGLIGIFVNVALYGVVLTQAHSYYATFRSDPKWMKTYVATLVIADSLNTGFNIAWIYECLVNQFGNVSALMRVSWLFASEHAMAGVIATMVQLFFGWRIWVLTRNRFIVAVVVLSSCVSCFGAIGTAIAVGMRPDVSGFRSLDVVALPWLIACTVCDITIAVTLTWYLSTHRTGFEETDNIINKLIRSTVQNGLLTASCTIAHIVTYLSLKIAVHMVFNYTVVKLYTNSVLSSLNSRNDLTNESSRPVTSFKNFGGQESFVRTRSSRHPQVTISVETHEMVDLGPLPTHKQEHEWDRSTSSESVKADTDLGTRYRPGSQS